MHLYPTSCHKRSEATRSNCYWNHGHEWSVSWHRFCRLWTFKVTIYWGSGSRAGMVAATSLGPATSGRAHSESAFPTPPLRPPHSEPRDAPDGFGQRRPPCRSSSPPLPPPTPQGPLLRPSAPGTLRAKLWRPNGGRKMTRPARLRTPSPNRVTWRPQRGARCVPPRRPRAASPRAVGDETAEGAGWEPGGVGGWQLVPGLTCSRAGGWRRRGRGEGASPRGTCGGAHGRRAASPPSPSPARPQSCAVGLRCPEQFLSPAQAPGRRERAHVHTQRGKGRPTFSRLRRASPGHASGGRELQQERRRDGENFLGSAWGRDYSPICLCGLESKGIPERVGSARVALGENGRACLRRVKLPFKLRPPGQAMLRGGLTRGRLGLPAGRLEKRQVRSVTWIPAVGPRAVSFGEGVRNWHPKGCRARQRRAKIKEEVLWCCCSHHK